MQMTYPSYLVEVIKAVCVGQIILKVTNELRIQYYTKWTGHIDLRALEAQHIKLNMKKKEGF